MSFDMQTEKEWGLGIRRDFNTNLSGSSVTVFVSLSEY
jgi:hypothetical protein